MTATMAQIRTTSTDEAGNRFNRWAILDTDETTIAELLADIDTDEICWVWVHEDHQGNGHAARLYATATTERTIYHAPTSHRTPEGNRWAHSVGGPSLPDCTTCCADLEY